MSKKATKKATLPAQVAEVFGVDLNGNANPAQPLAVPAQPANQPESVPGMLAAREHFQRVEEIKHAASATARSIVKASLARMDAWQVYAKAIPHIDYLEAAVGALREALTKEGYARAAQEASDWKAFAIVYHYDTETAKHVIDPSRTVPVTDKDGKVQLDEKGEKIMRRPSSDQIMGDLRAVRLRLSKEGKIPATVWNPPKARAESSASKLTSIQYDAAMRYLKDADDNQFNSLFTVLLGEACNRSQDGTKLAMFASMIHEEQVKRGWNKARETLKV